MSMQKINKAQKVIDWLIIIGVLLTAGYFVTKVILHELRPRAVISIGKSVFRADIADATNKPQKLLQNRSSIGGNEAILYKFDSDALWSTQMRLMRFPIDIVWLDNDRRVVCIFENVQPDAEPYKTYSPEQPARYIMKMPAGSVNKSGIKIGTLAKFDISKEGL